MKMHCESGGIAPHILNLGTTWRLWPSCPGCFALREITVPIGQKAGWVPNPVQTWWWRDKIPAPTVKWTPVGQSIAYLLYWLSYPSTWQYNGEFLATSDLSTIKLKANLLNVLITNLWKKLKLKDLFLTFHLTSLWWKHSPYGQRLLVSLQFHQMLRVQTKHGVPDH
jgi:hypothetical protein